MFTGIIEEIGTVKLLHKQANSSALEVYAETVLEDVRLGDSISVNGVCLTVTSFSSESFTADVMPETVKATSLHLLQPGSKVNLERAIAAGGRFGGHFVTGHVDGVGRIINKVHQANAVYYDILLQDDTSLYCIPKGSIAIDGTSLTVFKVNDDTITISLIPHTHEKTVLGSKGKGDIVNIETDLFAKYILKKTESVKKSSSLSIDFLQENGFY
ncbi:riboflavin synthase [Peribacillus deserti]|uniref:Riboflavin synthase n=1 Tax=Peribacillus deserti TaxID=673318 RepID=A0ABS2QLT7_9BACI|nr:riboflavin synthase [Peribacillus deserti]MBM7693679.1 riboflavin synthase [Peribacillus deserti]